MWTLNTDLSWMLLFKLTVDSCINVSSSPWQLNGTRLLALHSTHSTVLTWDEQSSVFLLDGAWLVTSSPLIFDGSTGSRPGPVSLWQGVLCLECETGQSVLCLECETGQCEHCVLAPLSLASVASWCRCNVSASPRWVFTKRGWHRLRRGQWMRLACVSSTSAHVSSNACLSDCSHFLTTAPLHTAWKYNKV